MHFDCLASHSYIATWLATETWMLHTFLLLPLHYVKPKAYKTNRHTTENVLFGATIFYMYTYLYRSQLYPSPLQLQLRNFLLIMTATAAKSHSKILLHTTYNSVIYTYIKSKCIKSFAWMSFCWIYARFWQFCYRQYVWCKCACIHKEMMLSTFCD